MRSVRFAGAALALLLAACGADEASRLAYNRALEALAAGKLGEAQAAAERAAAGHDRSIAVMAGFVRGNVAFERCRLAQRQARTAAAEPFAFDVAIAFATKARRLWIDAATSRDDWPAARRNVARADLELKKLRELKRKAEQQRRQTASARPAPPLPQPRDRPPAPRPQPTEPGREPAPVLTELSPGGVAALLERLKRIEKEKLATRRARRAQRSASEERDW